MSTRQKCVPYRNESVLVMSGNERHVSVDRKMLKTLGYTNVTHLTSHELGHEHLGRNTPDLLIVGSSLTDGSGHDFIRASRKMFPETVVPSVMVTLCNRKNDVLEAIGAGCAGYVLRPYSMDTISRHISVALDSFRINPLDNEQLTMARELVSAACFDEAISEFAELVPHENEADRYFSMGTRALMEGKFGKAIIAFNKALALNALYAEAYRGMADAYKGKGDMEKYGEYLKSAADIFAQQNRHQEVKDLFIEILRLDPNAVNPYNKVGMRLRKDGDYQSALQMYFQAQELSPDDENLCFNIAKAYMYLEDFESSCRYLRESLKINPEFEQAGTLLTKLQRKKG